MTSKQPSGLNPENRPQPHSATSPHRTRTRRYAIWLFIISFFAVSLVTMFAMLYIAAGGGA